MLKYLCKYQAKFFIIKKKENLTLVEVHSKQGIEYQNNPRKMRFRVCMLTFFSFFLNFGAVVIGDLNYYVATLRYFDSS